LELTLEELFTGCTKQKSITRRTIDANGIERSEEKVLSVEIKPGLLNGSRIVIPQEGDRFPDKVPANVVFIIGEKPHSTFKRARFDLKYTATISSETNSERKVCCCHCPRFNSLMLILIFPSQTILMSDLSVQLSEIINKKYSGKRIAIDFQFNYLILF